jgi:N-acetylneuraminate synthase
MRLQRRKKRESIGSNGVYIIAEIGGNHQGDVDVAKRMIEIAKYCEVDAVKLQKRDVKTYLTPEQYHKPYDNPHSFGKTYGEHREYLELSVDEHAELKEHAESLGLTYFVSVWDNVSARQMLDLGCEIIKVPSACITDAQMLAVLDKSGVPVLASVGMSTLEEIDLLVERLCNIKDLYLLQCTSNYPCDFKDINLNVIQSLKDRYAGKVKGVGFSGHHLGIAIDIAAVAMGACMLERHFTLDRTMKGTDHAASLEPEGMRRLVRDVRAFEKARGSSVKERLDCEKSSWEKLRKIKEPDEIKDTHGQQQQGNGAAARDRRVCQSV